MSNWVIVPIERVPAEEYAGWNVDRMINLDQVIEVSLSAEVNECYIHYADGTDEYITGVTALPFYQQCLRKILGKDGE